MCNQLLSVLDATWHGMKATLPLLAAAEAEGQAPPYHDAPMCLQGVDDPGQRERDWV